MKTILTALLFLLLAAPERSMAGEYTLLYRSPQVEGAYPVARVTRRGFFTSFYVEGSTISRLVSIYDFAGQKIGERDYSRWMPGEDGASVPGKNLHVVTELTICPKPILEGHCEYNSEGYMFDSLTGATLYHSPKFNRQKPDFTADGEYMLGRFGWGPDEGGEYSPSTGTCLFQVDSGKELWCRDEAISQYSAFLSESAGIIAGDKAIYDFSSGERLLVFPQYAKEGEKVLKTLNPGAAIVIRAMSPDGRFFVATEGKCDESRTENYGWESACNLVRLSDVKTYFGEWNKGVIKREIMKLPLYGTHQIKPYYFLPDGLLLAYDPYPPRIRLINSEGEVVSEIVNQKADEMSPKSIWRLQPSVDLKKKLVIWPSAEENAWRVYSFDGKLVGDFVWDEPRGIRANVRSFEMINEREFIFSVDITTKVSKYGGQREYVAEVYRGRFEPESGD
ncbi:MAG TPA: hypothetical protein PK523_08395 [Elusimicrobiales bacterium]|nr:hypothetical protein [Elusimicrobiales bacterium]